jgi:hypothetical protein
MCLKGVEGEARTTRLSTVSLRDCLELGYTLLLVVTSAGTYPCIINAPPKFGGALIMHGYLGTYNVMQADLLGCRSSTVLTDLAAEALG